MEWKRKDLIIKAFGLSFMVHVCAFLVILGLGTPLARMNRNKPLVLDLLTIAPKESPLAEIAKIKDELPPAPKEELTKPRMQETPHVPLTDSGQVISQPIEQQLMEDAPSPQISQVLPVVSSIEPGGNPAVISQQPSMDVGANLCVRSDNKGVTAITQNSDHLFLDYQRRVRGLIEQAKTYPEFARKNEIEGVVMIMFAILSDGKVKDVSILRSSGSKLLDNAGVGTIQRANPFPPLSREMGEEQIQMRINIAFRLKS